MKSQTGGMMLPIAVVGVIAVGVLAFFVYQNQSPATPEQTNQPAISAQPSTTGATAPMGVVSYKDGTYKADGSYVSPGGPRDIGVTITLANGVVTDTTFEGRATDPTSKRFQGEFGSNFKVMVVGKNISDLNLGKVAGSSLTPKGFNDAVTKIKAQAAS